MDEESSMGCFLPRERVSEWEQAETPPPRRWQRDASSALPPQDDASSGGRPMVVPATRQRAGRIVGATCGRLLEKGKGGGQRPPRPEPSGRFVNRPYGAFPDLTPGSRRPWPGICAGAPGPEGRPRHPRLRWRWHPRSPFPGLRPDTCAAGPDPVRPPRRPRSRRPE